MIVMDFNPNDFVMSDGKDFDMIAFMKSIIDRYANNNGCTTTQATKEINWLDMKIVSLADNSELHRITISLIGEKTSIAIGLSKKIDVAIKEELGAMLSQEKIDRLNKRIRNAIK